MFSNFEPPIGICALCGETVNMGGVYYYCKKCETLGNIHSDGKVYAVSGKAEQLDESRRLWKQVEKSRV